MINFFYDFLYFIKNNNIEELYNKVIYINFLKKNIIFNLELNNENYFLKKNFFKNKYTNYYINFNDVKKNIKQKKILFYLESKKFILLKKNILCKNLLYKYFIYIYINFNFYFKNNNLLLLNLEKKYKELIIILCKKKIFIINYNENIFILQVKIFFLKNIFFLNIFKQTISNIKFIINKKEFYFNNKFNYLNKVNFFFCFKKYLINFNFLIVNINLFITYFKNNKIIRIFSYFNNIYLYSKKKYLKKKIFFKSNIEINFSFFKNNNIVNFNFENYIILYYCLKNKIVIFTNYCNENILELTIPSCKYI